jgi:hypothetical protein
MVRNVGGTDKIIRIIFGLAIIVAGLLARSWWGIIGIIPLLTAIFSFCPAYLPFGIKTCKTK